MMNNSIYENNYKALMKRWPDYAELLKEPEISKDINCEVIETDGIMLPVVHKDGRTYQLASAYSDEAIMDRWAGMVDFQIYQAVIYIFGLGTGMYVRRLLKMAEESKSTELSILVTEPNFSIIKQLMNYYDYSDIFSDKKVELVIEDENYDKLRKWTISHVNDQNVHSACSVFYLNYPHIYEEEVAIYKEKVDYLVGVYLGNIGAMRAHSDYIYENTLKNIPVLANSWSVASLADTIPEDIPVFVISSGPSLSKNVHELKRAKGRSIIIAVDSSLAVLNKAGVIPDMYVSLDPQKKSDNYVFDWVPEVTAVVDMGSPEYAIRENQRYFMLDTYDTYSKLYINRCAEGIPYQTRISGGGCVAHHAFILAVAMGVKNLILVGQDLAYTGDKVHAGDREGAASGYGQIEIEGVNGTTVKSDRMMLDYKDWFEDAFSLYEEDGLFVVDATEGGALIKNTHVMTLKDAIDKYCVRKWDAEAMLGASKRLFNETEKEGFYDRIREVPSKMDDIIHNSKKLIDYYDKLEESIRKGKVTTGKVKRILYNTRRLSDKIENNEAFCYVDMANSDSELNVMKTVNNTNPDKTQDMINICNLGREHTENILEAAERVKKDFSELEI